MLKPTASYRMSKQTKRSIALGHYRSEEARSSWKRAMIQAELSAAIQPRISKNRKEPTGE